MITKYKLFIESAKFSDIFKYNGSDEEFINYKNQNFIDDCDLVDKVYVEYYDKLIYLKWINSPHHSIKERIKTRTSIKSVTEFNDIITNSIINLIKNHLDEIVKESKDYFDKTIAVKIPNIQLYLVIQYEPRNLYDDDTTFLIKTIVQNINEKTVDDIFNLS